jgi:hypothetical protein
MMAIQKNYRHVLQRKQEIIITTTTAVMTNIYDDDAVITRMKTVGWAGGTRFGTGLWTDAL